jgi:hypothetical protein
MIEPQTELPRVPVMLRVGTLVTIIVSMFGLVIWTAPVLVKVVRWVDHREAFEAKMIYEMEQLRATKVVERTSDGWHLNAMCAWSSELQDEFTRANIGVKVPSPKGIPWWNPQNQQWESR